MKKVVWLEAIQPRPYSTGKPGDAKSNYDASQKDEAGPLTKNEMNRKIAHKERGQLRNSGGLLSDTFNDPQSHGSSLVQLGGLLERDLKELDGLLNGLDKKLEKSRVEEMNRKGMHPEIRELMDKLKSGPSLDLDTAVKLAIHTKKWNRQFAKPVDGAAAKAEERGKPPRKGNQSNSQKRQRLLWPYSRLEEYQRFFSNFMLVELVLALLLITFPPDDRKEITWHEFKTVFLDQGLVNRLTFINRSRVCVELHRETVAKKYPESPAQQAHFFYYLSVNSIEDFGRKLNEAQDDLDMPHSKRIEVSYVNKYPGVLICSDFWHWLNRTSLIFLLLEYSPNDVAPNYVLL